MDENNTPIRLESIDVPTRSEYYWCLDLKKMDFMLRPIVTLEEIETPALMLSILGYIVTIPTSWNCLIYCKETMQLDVAEAHELTKGHFSAAVYDLRKECVLPDVGNISALDYIPNTKIVTPTLKKCTMLCHPLGLHHWCCFSPTDYYTKYLQDKVIGDLY